MSDINIHQTRIRFIIGTVIFVGVLVIIRLFSLQVLQGTAYKQRAKHQYVTPIGSFFDRGNIYFTNKNGTTIAAATVEDGFKVAIVPAQLGDPEYTYDALNAIIPIDRDDFFASSAKKTIPMRKSLSESLPSNRNRSARSNFLG